MLVSGNMTSKKMGRKVGKKFYFKKKFWPIFYFMTHLFPTAQLKNRGVEAQGHKKKLFHFLFICFIESNKGSSQFYKGLTMIEKKKEKNKIIIIIFFFFFLGNKIY